MHNIARRKFIYVYKIWPVWNSYMYTYMYVHAFMKFLNVYTIWTAWNFFMYSQYDLYEISIFIHNIYKQQMIHKGKWSDDIDQILNINWCFLTSLNLLEYCELTFRDSNFTVKPQTCNPHTWKENLWTAHRYVQNCSSHGKSQSLLLIVISIFPIK